jgi:Flp pilus assembly protein TadG
MRSKRIRKILENDKGQNLVEFALILPLLLLVVIGIAEFGRAWMAKNIMTGAAREAVRILAVPSGSIQTASDRADNVLVSAGITTATKSLDIGLVAYDPVSVTINYDFPVLFAGFIPGLSIDNILLTSTTTMRREY